MPNWCENAVDITGPKEAIQEFIAQLSDNEGDTPMLSFCALLPIPYKHEKPIEWARDNWGTKWDLSKEEGVPFHSSEDLLSYAFDTAWGPPLVFFQTVSVDFPELEFDIRYIEPGMEFAGSSLFKAGEEVESVYYDENVLPQYVQFAYEHFGYELDLEEEEV